jgi:hypothetical protein
MFIDIDSSVFALHTGQAAGTVHTQSLTLVTMKNGFFWDATPCGSCKNLVFLRIVRRLPVTASVLPSSPILVTLMKDALSSSETSALRTATRRNILEDAILHSHRRENPKSYTRNRVNYFQPPHSKALFEIVVFRNICESLALLTVTV